MTRLMLTTALGLALATPMHATSLPLQATAVPPVAEGAIRLAPGDVLSVAVARFPELGRDAVVADDGAIRIGGAGAVPIAGLTVDEAQAAIAAALVKGLGVEPRAVLVDVAQYRPVIVHGDGRRSTEIAFRPGLTVLQAVAATGGQRIDLSGSLTEALEAERTLSRQGDEADRLARARAGLARLRAEREGVDVVAADLGGLGIADGRQAEIRAAEDRLRALRDSRFTEQNANLASQRASVVRQIESLAREMDLLRQREALAEEQMKASESLAKRGLGTQDRLRETRTDLVDVQLLIVRILAERSDAETRLVVTDSLIADLSAVRDLEIAEAIRQAEGELASAERGLAAARSEVGLAADHLGGLTSRQQEQATAYKLQRLLDDGTYAETAVTAETRLRPADVIQVVRR